MLMTCMQLKKGMKMWAYTMNKKSNFEQEKRGTKNAFCFWWTSKS